MNLYKIRLVKNLLFFYLKMFTESNIIIMEGYLNVFDNKIADLIQTFVKERSEKKMEYFLNFSVKDNLDVYYIPLVDKDTGELNKDFPQYGEFIY